MQTIRLDSWEQFELKRKEFVTPSTHEFAKYLFRGQANACWELSTTLERQDGADLSIKEFYRKMCRLAPEIASFTDNKWDIPGYDRILRKLDEFDLSIVKNGHQLPAGEYLVFLRQHGFPSPLLDWSFSPYVAAYFAFRIAFADADAVSIFMYSEMPNGEKSTSNKPSICSLNHQINAHRRHFLQQSRYTICFESENVLNNREGREPNINFVSHESVFVEDNKDCVFVIWNRRKPHGSTCQSRIFHVLSRN